MNIVFRDDNEPFEIHDGWHLLTVAESGFSMLSGYASEWGIDDNDIRAFEERINASNESGSLHPRAPVSAIPSKFFRELSESTDPGVAAEFKKHIEDFLAANDNAIKAANLMIDFRVSPSPVPQHYIDATSQVLRAYSSESLEKVVIQQG